MACRFRTPHTVRTEWRHFFFYFLNSTTWPQRRKHISKCLVQKTCRHQRWRTILTGWLESAISSAISKLFLLFILLFLYLKCSLDCALVMVTAFVRNLSERTIESIERWLSSRFFRSPTVLDSSIMLLRCIYVIFLYSTLNECSWKLGRFFKSCCRSWRLSYGFLFKAMSICDLRCNSSCNLWRAMQAALKILPLKSDFPVSCWFGE